MKIISVTLLIAFSVFSLNIQVFGHDPCSSERSEYDTAAAAVTRAGIRLGLAISAEAGYIWQLYEKGKPPLPYTKAELFLLAVLAANIVDAEDVLDAAESTRDSKKIALENCVLLDTRDCDNDGAYDDCSILHTQSVTSCECNCNYGAYGCECGSCSYN